LQDTAFSLSLSPQYPKMENMNRPVYVE
jgi:hypothetical protein